MADRFILRYRGSSLPPTEDLRKIENAEGLKIQEKSGKMIVVDAEKNVLQPLCEDLPNWIVVPEEHSFTIPDPKSKIKVSKPTKG